MPPDAPQPKPRLELVGGDGGARTAPEAREPRAGGRSRRLAPLLGVLLALASLALWVQTRRAGELGLRVAGLEAELAAARAELGAYRGQLGRVRAMMDDLSLRVAELRELVARDPGEPAPHPFEAPRP